MDHPLPWLRYVDATALDDKAQPATIAGMEVDDPAGEKIGTVEGFILDVDTGRPFHIVVDAGHWLRHKHVLLPVGHVMLEENGRKMMTSVSKERIARFPGFDRSEFEKMSKDELREMAKSMALVCGCPDEAFIAVEWETWNHYAYPSWWDATSYRPDRVEQRDEAGNPNPSGRANAADRGRAR
jgi:hypothetical protein